MASKKKKLNLTVAQDKRRRAEILAKLDNRSVSSLFETLIDEAWAAKEAAASPKKIGFDPTAEGASAGEVQAWLAKSILNRGDGAVFAPTIDGNKKPTSKK